MILTRSAYRSDVLLAYAKDASRIIVSTYNLFAGVLHDGTVMDKTSSRRTREFLDALSAKDAEVLVGLPRYCSCKGKERGEWIECTDCESDRQRYLDRIEQHIQKWPNIDFRWTLDWHLKAYLFETPCQGWTGFTGGVNLSSSSWIDVLTPVMVSPDDAEALRRIVCARLARTVPLVPGGMEPLKFV